MLIFLAISAVLLYFAFKKEKASSRLWFLIFTAFFTMLILWPTYLRIKVGPQGLPDNTNGFYLGAMIISFYILSSNLIYWIISNTKTFSNYKAKPYKVTSIYTTLLSIIAIFLYNRLGPTGSQLFSTIIMVILIYIAYLKCRASFLEWNLKKILPEDSSKYVLIDLDAESQNIIGANNKHIIHFIVKLNDGSVTFPESQNNTRYALTNVEFTPRYNSITTTNGRTGRTLLGGLLLGIPGAIAGASGKRRSSTTTYEENSDIMLTIVNLSNNDKHIIKAVGETKNANLLKTVFLYPKELTRDNNQTQQENNNDVPDSDIKKLRSLKELLDEGIITQQEFEAKKKQILKI